MHVLIVGTTLSGKTTLARKLARKAHSNGRGVFILDPLLDPAWKTAGADFITDNPIKFIEIAKANKNCTLFIDEAGEYCNQYQRETWWLATQARHWGHQSVFIGQRATMIAKNIRDNCSRLFCFRTSPSDAKLLADDFVCEELLDSPKLEQGKCFYAPRYAKPQVLDVFT